MLKSKKYLLVVLFLIPFVFYLPSINFGFVSDDVYLIKNNPDLGSLGYIFASPAYFISLIPHFIVFKVFGLAPFAYRFLNIFYHSLTSVLIYLCVRKIYTKDERVAIFSSILFAIHPINIESVTWISGFSSSFYTCLFMLSFVFYIYSVKLDKKYIISMVFLLLSLSASNKGISAPIIFVFYEFLLNKNKYSIKRVLIPIILSAVYVTISVFGIIPRLSSLKTEYYSRGSSASPFLSFPISLVDYFSILVFPYNLSLYRVYNTVNFVVLGLRYVFLIFVSLASFALFRNRKYKELFFIFFYYIALLPAAVPLGVAWLVAERYVYLASVGFFVLLSYLITLFAKKYSYFVFTMLVIFFSALFFFRIFDWKNEDSLWLKTIQTAPNYEVSYNNIGDVYSRHNENEKAIDAFLKSTKINPLYAPGYHNAALVYLKTQDFDNALLYFQKSVEANPRVYQSYEKMGEIYLYQKKDYTKAKENFEKALSLNSKLYSSYLNLGFCYLYLNDKEKAKAIFNDIIKLDPLNTSAQKGLLEADR